MGPRGTTEGSPGAKEEYQAHNSWPASGRRGQTIATTTTKTLFFPERINRSSHWSPLNKAKCWKPRNVVHFIIFSGSPGKGEGKLHCCLGEGEEPERGLVQRGDSTARQEWVISPHYVNGHLHRCVCFSFSGLHSGVLCSPRILQGSLLALPSCHLVSLTQLSLAEAEILIYCLNLEVTFSLGFVSRTNESLQCNLFCSLFKEFDLNFTNDKDDVLTRQAARIISPSIFHQSILLLPNIFSKSFFVYCSHSSVNTVYSSFGTPFVWPWGQIFMSSYHFCSGPTEKLDNTNHPNSFPILKLHLRYHQARGPEQKGSQSLCFLYTVRKSKGSGILHEKSWIIVTFPIINIFKIIFLDTRSVTFKEGGTTLSFLEWICVFFCCFFFFCASW